MQPGQLVKSGPTGVPLCPVASGEQSIAQLGLSYLTMADCGAVLVAYIVICRLIAYMGVRYITW